MPAKKNNHFVPRCALKPFSLNGGGLAINVFNIPRKLVIQNAPVKGQCARDYLYGKADQSAEDVLMKLEGQYSRVVSQLVAGIDLNDADEEWLRLFAMIQHRRTEAAIQQMRSMTESMTDAVFARAPDQRPRDDSSDAEVMHQSLRLAMEFMKYSVDLKVVVFTNRTSIDFVTSDHPAVLTNRFHFQRLHQNSFGISNSGAILSMPLSPRLTLWCYDKAVYSIPNASGTSFIELSRENDVRAVNDLQYLNSSKNIYFRQWEDVERIVAEVDAVSDQRAAAGPRTKILVRDHSGTGSDEVYRAGTTEEELTAKETVALTSIHQPVPKSWPAVLKYREKPKTFFAGTAVGHVRKPEWLHTRSRGKV